VSCSSRGTAALLASNAERAAVKHGNVNAALDSHSPVTRGALSIAAVAAVKATRAFECRQLKTRIAALRFPGLNGPRPSVVWRREKEKRSASASMRLPVAPRENRRTPRAGVMRGAPPVG
jgi:hypothetical protein